MSNFDLFEELKYEGATDWVFELVTKGMEEKDNEIALLTQQRDLWAQQCNYASERAADYLAENAQLRKRIQDLENNK